MAFLNIMILLLTSAIFTTRGDFPRNSKPKTVINLSDVEAQIFTGDDVRAENRLRRLQLIKWIRIGQNEYLAVASRDHLYFINPDKLGGKNSGKIQYDNVITWKSDNTTKELCSMKGKPKELCHNFLSVVETTNDQGSEILICGSNSFSPICTTYAVSVLSSGLALLRGDDFSGKQRCPFGPDQRSAAIFTGGSLYAGTYQAFTGVSPVVSRTMGEKAPLKTPTTDVTMNQPSFVKMLEDDERILVFFNEMEKLSTGETRMVAQVGQVCKNDVGGERVLARMWTTFIKARLNCSYNGFYLTELRDVTEMRIVRGVKTIFATFATPGDSLAGSAVCSFTANQIKRALNGSFLVSSGVTSQPAVGTSPSASRHPASCPSEKMTDSELFFIKSHPQMKDQVPGSLLLTNQGSRWTAVASDSNAGPNDVTMLFVGTEDGHVIRALGPNQTRKRNAIISKQEVFDSDRCSSIHPFDEDRKVLRILVDSARGFLVVGFKHCVITVPLRTCHIHLCQEECVGSADPYCGWDGASCVPYLRATQGLAQNVAGAITSPESYGSCEPVKQEPKNSFTFEKKLIEKATAKPKSRNGTIGGVILPPPKVECLKSPEPCSSKFSLTVLLVVGIGFFILGVVITFVTFVLCRKYDCCRSVADEKEFAQKQAEYQHAQVKLGGDRSNSLTRTVRKSYSGWKEWLCRPSKSNTPAPTPALSNKTDHEMPNLHHQSRQRRQNDYSEAPTLLKPAPQVQASKPRRVSSRHNSTSSAGSGSCVHMVTRQPSVIVNGPMAYEQARPLLNHSPTDDAYYSPTCESMQFVSEALTLPHPERAPHPSGDSPSFKVSLHGAAESGVLPTASAKLRRRNEKASFQTAEIMRDSDSAIRSIESALQQMQHQGIVCDDVRERLNSDDSGKGESVRNSMRTDCEPNMHFGPASKQRPSSLNIPQNGIGHRRRLTSEPSYPNDVITPTGSVSSGSSSGRRNAPVRQQSFTGYQQGNPTRSQPTTPVGGAPAKLSVYQGCQEVSLYATLPKNDPQIVGRRKQRQIQEQQQRQIEYMQQQQQKQRQQQQEEFNKRLLDSNQRRGFVTRSCGSPGKAPPPPLNRYPSLQVRGSNAYPEHHVSADAAKSQPVNHFQSLPRRASSSPYSMNNNNNSYVTNPPFERPTTLHRREKLPSMMRQTSAPAHANPKPIFVLPPTVPPNGVQEV